MNDPLGRLFDNLDTWKHLPNYQLERRADIFFSIYLAGLLKHKYGDTYTLIPEFPIHAKIVEEVAGKNHSFKIDYLAVPSESETLFFIELKTDIKSLSKKQRTKLEIASGGDGNKGRIVTIIEELKNLYRGTPEPKKYKHLFSILQRSNLLRDISYKKRPRSVGFVICNKAKNATIKTLFIQPVRTGKDNTDVVTFDEFAKYVSIQNDCLGQRFAASLLKWTNQLT